MRRSGLGGRGLALIVDTARRAGEKVVGVGEDHVDILRTSPLRTSSKPPNKKSITRGPKPRTRRHKKGCTPPHLRKRYAQLAERLSTRPTIGQQAAQEYLDTKHALPAFNRVYVDLVGASLWHLRDGVLAQEGRKKAKGEE